MEGLVDTLVILLSALVHASLQLGVGTLLLLYHESLGRKVRKVTKRVTRGFIFGAGIFVLLLLAAITLVILLQQQGPLGDSGLVTVIGVVMVTSLVIIAFYYQAGRNTMLWIPNWVAKYLEKRAQKAESGAEGLALGMTMSLGEVPFALILMVAAGNSVLNLPQAFQILAIAVYALITVMPLMIMKMAIKNGRTVADIQRWRVKNKNFLRVFLGVCYMVLAVFLIAFKLLGKG